MQPWPRGLVLVYGVVNLVLAIEAYARLNSLPSLIGGGIAGMALLFGWWLIGRNPRAGYIGSALVGFLLAAHFLRQYSLPTGQVWPHLGLGVMGALFFLALVAGHFLSKRQAASSSSA